MHGRKKKTSTRNYSDVEDSGPKSNTTVFTTIDLPNYKFWNKRRRKFAPKVEGVSKT